MHPSDISRAKVAAGVVTGKRPTSANLARVLGVHRSMITRYEQRIHTPSRNVVGRITTLLELYEKIAQTRRELESWLDYSGGDNEGIPQNPNGLRSRS